MCMVLSVSAINVILCPKGLRELLQRWSWADLLRIKTLIPGGISHFLFSHPSESKLPSPHSGSWEGYNCPVGSRICLALVVGKGLSDSLPTALGKAEDATQGFLYAEAPRIPQPGPQANC